MNEMILLSTLNDNGLTLVAIIAVAAFILVKYFNNVTYIDTQIKKAIRIADNEYQKFVIKRVLDKEDNKRGEK